MRRFRIINQITRFQITRFENVIMSEALLQSFQNLRANKLRSILTMFGILWGVVSIVVLSAMGEGFRRGNDHVLREFGKNIAILWGGRTSLQAGGERAG